MPYLNVLKDYGFYTIEIIAEQTVFRFAESVLTFITSRTIVRVKIL